MVKLVGFLKDHADVVQAGDEAAAVDFLAAAGAVAENRMMSVQCWREPGGEGQSLGVVDQRDEAGLAVGVIAHQDGQLAAAFEGTGLQLRMNWP